MRSLMVQRSTISAIVFRAFGCFFVPNFSGKSLAQAKVTWKSIYTCYALACFVVYLSAETAFVIRYVDVLRDVSHTFSRSLLLTVHMVVTARITGNLAAMLTGQEKLLEFFQNSESFEKTIGLLPRARGARGKTSTHRWSTIRAFLVIFGMALCYAAGVYFTMGQIAQSIGARWVLPVRIIGVFMAAGFIVYDSLPYLLLRNSATVLVEYIRAQLEAFKKCKRSSPINLQSKVSGQIESIRLNMSKVKKLKESLNDIWTWPLMVASASLVTMNCFVFNGIFHDGFKQEIWLSITYALHASLCFIDLAFVSQALVDETRKLKNATLVVPTFEAREDLLHQLRFLHETIDPDAMCFSGGGFFSIKNSLLVSITGSIIVYTVILVQTSDTMSLKIDADAT